MRIDAHTHVTGDGKWLAGEHLASVDELLRQMDAARVDHAFVLPIAGSIRVADVLAAARGHGDRLSVFGVVGAATWRDDLATCAGEGLRGIKFHPRLQRETLDDLERSGALAELTTLGRPLLICGWPQSGSAEVPMSALAPARVDELARRWPQLTMILAHMGGHHMWDAVFCARANPNVYLDCSYFLSFFAGTSLAEDFWRALPRIDRKLLYGSDFPEADLVGCAAEFDGRLAQVACDRDAVWGGNAGRLTGL